MALPRFTLPGDGADFLRDYWQQRPLLMRQAAQDVDLVDGDMLAGLALEESVESRLITGGDAGDWQARSGPFTEADFAALPASNWTLLLQSVDHYLTETSLLLDSFNFLPAWRIEDIMISYAAKGGGVGPHFDHYDVFLIQTAGTRRWRLGPRCDANSPLQDNDSLKLLAAMPVTEEFVLEPGDVLYLPPGIAHWGSATSDDCITWSVGFRAPELHQLLDWLLAESEAARGLTLFADAGRGLPADASVAAADIEAMTHQAKAIFDQIPLTSSLCKWLSLPRQDTLELLGVDDAALLSLNPNAVLVRHGGARLLAENASASRVWINGEVYDIAADAQPLAQKLIHKRLFEEQELTLLMQSPAARALLSDWIDAGYFYQL